jgi:hypothetical protein
MRRHTPRRWRRSALAAGLAMSAIVVIPAGIVHARPYVDVKVRSQDGTSYVLELSVTNVTEDTQVLLKAESWGDGGGNLFRAEINWWANDNGSIPAQCVQKNPYANMNVYADGLVCNIKAGETVQGAVGMTAADGSGLAIRLQHDGINWRFGRDQQRTNRPLIDPAPPNPQPGIPQVEVKTTFEDGHGPFVFSGEQIIAHIRITPREVAPDQWGIQKFSEPMNIEITASGELGTIDSVNGELYLSGWDNPAALYGPGGNCTWKYNWAVTTAGDWYWGKCTWTPNRNSAWLDVRVVINSRSGDGWIQTRINGVDLDAAHAGGTRAASGTSAVETTPEPPPQDIVAEQAESPLEEVFS